MGVPVPCKGLPPPPAPHPPPPPHTYKFKRFGDSASPDKKFPVEAVPFNLLIKLVCLPNFAGDQKSKSVPCFPKSGPRTFFGPQECEIWSARKKTCKYSFKNTVFLAS